MTTYSAGTITTYSASGLELWFEIDPLRASRRLTRHHHPVPSPFLGRVQRRVRLLGQALLGRRRLRARSHPERRAERASLPLPPPLALAERLPQTLRHLPPPFQGRARQPHRELLP